MKVLSLGTDRKLFEENSAVRRRQIEYGKFFDEMHIIVFSRRNSKLALTRPYRHGRMAQAGGYQISENIFVYPTNSINRFFYIWDAFKVSRRIINNSKLIIQNSVVSCQDPFETGLVGAAIKLFYDLPLHIQIHTDFAHKYFGRDSIINKIRYDFAEFVLKSADRVRVVSERIKKSIEGLSKKVDVLPIVVQWNSRGRSSKGTEARPLGVLTVCRLEKEKNLETAIRAFKMVSEKFPEAVFTIVGDGSERKKLEQLSHNLGLTDKVVFAGWQNDLEKYYNKANVYISTSLFEGYGMSIVEAAVNGLPVILSSTGLVGDTFKDEDSTLVCDALDSDCFAKNILRLFNDQILAERISKKAKEEAEKHLLIFGENYFQKYADSIKATAKDFKSEKFSHRAGIMMKDFFSSVVYARFLVCGSISTIIDLVLLYIFIEKFSIWYLHASALALVTSLIASFIMQKFLVFRDMKIDGVKWQFSKFTIVLALGLIINTALVFVCVDIFGIWYIISQIIAGFFVVIQNFLLYKHFIFNRR
jgi:glycosyltransferase involved in cell wall biosynthesis/putative flippase GtrA